MLNQRFEAQASVEETLYAPMLFLHLADPAADASFLRQEIANGSESIKKLAVLRKELEPVLSTGGQHLMRHLDQRRRLYRRWLQQVLKAVTAGRVRDVRDPKRLVSKR
jgi:hypothetical protein